MKHILLLSIFFASVHLAAVEQTYTLDFSDDFGMDAFEGIPLRQFGRSDITLNLPNDSRYLVKLPSGNEFVFESYVTDISTNYQNTGLAARLVLSSSKPDYYLTSEEALAVLEAFQEAFDIPKEPLYEWFEPIQDGQLATSFYYAGARTHYPKITLKVLNSFFKDRPVFLNLIISFDEKSFRRLGVSEETNKVTNLTFDVPAIVESVRNAQRNKAPSLSVEETISPPEPDAPN